MPSTGDERVNPGRLAFAVFATVVVLIAIVLAAQLIPDAQRPTIRQPPITTTTTVVVSSTASSP